MGEPSPTYRELCSEFGWTSTATVRDHLRALSRKGYIELPQRRARAIRLKPQRPRATKVPVIGQIAAGTPVQTEQYSEGTIAAPPEWVRHGVHFAVRVSGDSMKDAGILHGDHVVARAQSHASHGDIVVATIDGETTLKRLKKRGAGWWLVPENERYPPISIKDQSTIIQGVMVGLLRGNLPFDAALQVGVQPKPKKGGKK